MEKETIVLEWKLDRTIEECESLAESADDLLVNIMANIESYKDFYTEEERDAISSKIAMFRSFLSQELGKGFKKRCLKKN